MALERTLSIIKPDAVAKNVIGQIYARFEGAGLKVIAAQDGAALARRGRGVLRRAPRASVLRRPGLVHDLRPGDDPGARRRRRDRQESRADGRDRSEEGRPRHDPRRLRRQHRRQRRARLRRRRDGGGRDRVLLRRHEPLHVAEPASPGWSTCSSSTATRSPTGASNRASRRFARPSCSAGSTSAASSDFAAMSNLAKSFRDKLIAGRRGRRAAGRQRAGRRGRHDQVAVRRRRAATPSRPSSSPRPGAARCASRRRPAAPSTAASAPPATRASAATSRTAEIVAQLWHAEFELRRRLGLRRRRARDHQRRDDGHGRAAAELRRARAGAAHDARRPRLRPLAPSRHRLDLGRRADDRPAARRLPGRARGVAARARRRAARRARPAQPQVPDRRAARVGAALPRARAARLHHDRVLHARRRQRLAGAGRGPARAAARRRQRRAAGPGVQGQPHSVQSVRGVGPEALAGGAASPRSRRSSRTAASSRRCARRAATTSPPPAASSPAKCRTARASPSGAHARCRCASRCPCRADASADGAAGRRP